jgi:hypothetical protein
MVSESCGDFLCLDPETCNKSRLDVARSNSLVLC